VKHLAYLNKYFFRYKWRILAGIFFVICANALSVYNPVITGNAVDLIAGSIKKVQTGENAHSMIAGGVGRDVLFLFLRFLVVALLAGGFTFLMRQTIIVVSRLIEFDLKNDIYDHYQQLDLAFYRKNNTGDLMNRITEDVSRVRMYVGPAIMYSVNLFFTITFTIVSMLIINPTLTLWALIPLPVLSVIIYYVNELVERASTRIQAQLSDMTTDAQETYSGIRVVQAYVREKEMFKHFAEESEEYKRRQISMAKIDAIYFPSMIFLIGCSIIIVVFVGGLQVAAGKLSAGGLVKFIMYINMLMWPVSSLGWVASMIQRAIASQKRINEFLEYKSDIKEDQGIEHEIKGEVTFDQVSFTYPDTGIKALKDVSFKINAGQRLAIIGRTGSGKSTLADLMMRMYDPTSGKIMVDGINLKDFKLGAYRRQIGFVPQDIPFFRNYYR